MLPQEVNSYKTRSLDYFTFLLSYNEGEEMSLQKTLEKLGYLNKESENQLFVHYGDLHEEFTVFNIDVKLSEEGLENYKHVIEIAFSHLKALNILDI